MRIIASLILFISIAGAEKRVHPLHWLIYDEYTNVSPCFMRLNGTHAFGCTSNHNGNIGVVYIVADYLQLYNLKTMTDEQHIVVIPRRMFNREILRFLNDTETVNGVVLVKDHDFNSVDSFSHQDTCPNRYSGLSELDKTEGTCSDETPWNPYGTGLMFEKWRFPIFLIPGDIFIKILGCYKKYNEYNFDPWNNPRCALRMNSHMYASRNSRVCLRRSETRINVNQVFYCDPLGDKSIYFPMMPFTKYVKHDRYLTIIAAPFDAASMFYDDTPGSLSTATSIVTLLMTAKLLRQMIPIQNSTYEKNVLFVLFNGEAFDYIGSSRMVYEISQGNFPDAKYPINLKNVELFIELSQIQYTKSLFVHYLSRNKTEPKVREFMEIFQNTTAPFKISVEDRSDDAVFPPSSAQSFISADSAIPAAVISSYEDQFSNKFYHSVYDMASNVGYSYAKGTYKRNSIQMHIANVSSALSCALYIKLTGQNQCPQNITASFTEVDELMHCYFNDLECNTVLNLGLHEDVGGPNSVEINKKPNYYIGIRRSINSLTPITYFVLSNFTGKVVSNVTSVDQCNVLAVERELEYYYWVKNGSYCVQSLVGIAEAVSPAFIIPDYDMNSNKYSTWTESAWREMNLQMFLIPSNHHEFTTLGYGLIVALLSIFATYYVNKYYAK